MRILVNLRHVEKKPLRLHGEWPASELDLDVVDELVRVRHPLIYDFQAERMNQSVLVRGLLRFVLTCECARCLTPYEQVVEMADWTCNLPLDGEDRVPVDNDCVDLTPFLREDILLAFPQHPLCRTECSGLPNAPHKNELAGGASHISVVSSAWAELNKLKF